MLSSVKNFSKCGITGRIKVPIWKWNVSPGQAVAGTATFIGGAPTIVWRFSDGSTINNSPINKTIAGAWNFWLEGKYLKYISSFVFSSSNLIGEIPVPSRLSNLSSFSCPSNQITGSIPNLSSNPALLTFYCHANQITGSLKSLSANTALTTFSCHTNQFTGSIPNLSANTALLTFSCHTNQLTGFSGGAIPSSITNFSAHNNLLTASAVNSILVACDTAWGAGAKILSIGGTGNAAPTGAGITAKASLISKGHTVTTN